MADAENRLKDLLMKKRCIIMPYNCPGSDDQQCPDLDNKKLGTLELGVANMRLFLAIFLFLIGAGATVNPCDDEIQKTLNCLGEKFRDPGKSAIFLDEYANDFQTLVKETSGKYAAHVMGLSRACPLNPSTFEGDFFGPQGPMAGNPTLRAAAVHLRDLLFNSLSSSKNANAGLCLKKALGKLLLDEIRPCVSVKANDIYVRIPEMPNYDEKLIKKQDALNATTFLAMVHNKLRECLQNSPKTAYNLDNLFKVQSNKFFKKHCDAVAACIKKPVCVPQANVMKKSSCSCINELREQWHNSFGKVRSMTKNFSDRDFCIKILNEGMGKWRTKLRNAVDACVKDQGEKHPFAVIIDDTAVSAACVQLATITDEKRHKVLDAVQAFHSFLAAINDNAIRFCDIECLKN